MAKRLALDRILFASVLILLAYGVLMVYSSSAVLSMDIYGNSYTFFIKHLVIASFAFALMLFISGMDYKKLMLKRFVGLVLLASLLLLVIVLMLNPLNNTHRWIRFGMFSFQPSELAKLAVVIFMARYLAVNKEDINKKGLRILPILSVVGPLIFLVIIEPDVGTGLTILFIVLVMLFSAGLTLRYYLVGLLGLCAGIYYLVISSQYRMERILAFLDPWADPLGYGFQPIQSIIAIGSGGLFGTGITAGTQKYFYLPTPHTDFIYSVIGEELGFVGSMVLLLLFCCIFWRGIRIALRTNNDFGKYLAFGITVMIVGQAFINISVALTLFPTKGIPLPLVSFGGTSMLISLVSTGILLNISRYTT